MAAIEKEKALDVVRQMVADGQVSQEVAEKYFPELKSEDERIRKELIEQVVYIVPNEDEVDSEGNVLPTYQKRIDKYLAWLEKQGEHANFRNKIQIGDKVTRNEDGVLVNLSQFERVVKETEKQGEQKLIQGALEEQGMEFKDDKIVEVEKPFHIENGKYYTCIKDCSLNKEYHKGGVYKAVVNRIGKISLTSDGDYVFPMKNEPVFNEYFRLATNEEIEEISGNQGKISPNEPKFKKGEWVVYDGWTTQIMEVYEDGYANDRQGFIPKVREDSMRKWTIQDAKDGDVLAETYNEQGKPWVGIFKCFNDRRPVKTFDSYCFITSGEHSFVTPSGCFYNRCVGHGCSHTQPATSDECKILFQKMKEAGYEWDAKYKQLKKIEQKLAEWSEEDEKLINSIIELIDNGALDRDEKDYFIDKLKSLKDKVQPQNTWKPSDNELEVLRLAAEKDGTCLMGLYEQLKKLREE